MVRKVDSGHEHGLQEGDVILTLNGKLITRVSDLDIMYDNDVLDAVVVRKREQMRIGAWHRHVEIAGAQDQRIARPREERRCAELAFVLGP